MLVLCDVCQTIMYKIYTLRKRIKLFGNTLELVMLALTKSLKNSLEIDISVLRSV